MAAQRRRNMLDAIRPTPFNPLAKEALTRSVESELLNQDTIRLDCVPEFMGVGIYVLYYKGVPHRIYEPINGTDVPIYVGKAVPRGSRKALADVSESGFELWERIDEHRDSISHAYDLHPANFTVRFLVTDELFIALAERLMIRTFRPVWNQVVDGFGNHDPGAGRYNQRVAPWDVLHPGRPWVGRLKGSPKMSRIEIVSLVKEHFLRTPPTPAIADLPPDPGPDEGLPFDEDPESSP
jgi:Eco29kI-like restriction endonuclease